MQGPQQQGEDRNRGRWDILFWIIWLPIFPLCLCLASQFAMWGPESSTQALGVQVPEPDYSGDATVSWFKPLSPDIIVEIIADQVLAVSPIHPGEEELNAIVAARLADIPALLSPTAKSDSAPESKPTDSSVPTTDGEPMPVAIDTTESTSVGAPTPTVVGKLTPTAINEATSSVTNEHTPTATGTGMPIATNTPTPPATDTPPTNTPAPAATNTPAPAATNTLAPTATNTPAPTATNTPAPAETSTPTPAVGEIVQIFQVTYHQSTQTLVVKARTNLSGCSLTLVGFGSMTLEEGEHWVYTEENLAPEDAPSTVTVVSSCGGSDTSPVTGS